MSVIVQDGGDLGGNKVDGDFWSLDIIFFCVGLTINI
jgi:hypothetical protein